jgi:hypothetical protein
MTPVGVLGHGVLRRGRLSYLAHGRGDVEAGWGGELEQCAGAPLISSQSSVPPTALSSRGAVLVLA